MSDYVTPEVQQLDAAIRDLIHQRDLARDQAQMWEARCVAAGIGGTDNRSTPERVTANHEAHKGSTHPYQYCWWCEHDHPLGSVPSMIRLRVKARALVDALDGFHHEGPVDEGVVQAAIDSLRDEVMRTEAAP